MMAKRCLTWELFTAICERIEGRPRSAWPECSIDNLDDMAGQQGWMAEGPLFHFIVNEFV